MRSGRSSCHPPTPAPEKPRPTILRGEEEEEGEEERAGQEVVWRKGINCAFGFVQHPEETFSSVAEEKVTQSTCPLVSETLEHVLPNHLTTTVANQLVEMCL